MSYLNSHHEELQRSVCDKFVLCGFVTASNGYEFNPSLLPLKNIVNDSTTMIIRTEPDTIVYNKKLSFLLEFKTGTSPYKINIEALPLIHHEILATKLNVQTIYFCKIPNKDFVFCSSDLPRISSITIPCNKVYPCKKEMEQWAIEKGIPVNTGSFDRQYGSGDPFITITYKECAIKPTINEFISKSIM